MVWKVRRALSAVFLCGAAAFAPAGPAVAQPDLNCTDFVTQVDAQNTYNADVSDPYGLDADGDGIACENLLPGGAEGTGLPDTGGPGGLPLIGALLVAAGAALWPRRPRLAGSLAAGREESK